MMQPQSPRAQQERVEAISRSFAELLPLSRFERIRHRDQASVKPLAKLGCVGFSLSVQERGGGLSVTDEVLLFERLGRQLVTPSLVAAVLGAHIAMGNGDKPMATAIIAGDWILSFATRAGTSKQVILYDAQDADLLLLADGDELVLVQNSITSERRIVDRNKWGLVVEAAKIESPPIHRATGDERSRMSLLCASQQAGIANAARDCAERSGISARDLAEMGSWAKAAMDALTNAGEALGERCIDAARQCQGALLIASQAARTNAAIHAEADGHNGRGYARLFAQRALAWDAIAGGETVSI